MVRFILPYITFTAPKREKNISAFSITSYESSERSIFLRTPMKFTVIFLAMASVCHGDVSHLLHALRQSAYYEATPPPTTTEGPYSFEYKAGRYPGHVDRVQSEFGDGSGRAQGSYAFIDPKFKVRTVQYTVDENGFHPSLINYEDVLKQP